MELSRLGMFLYLIAVISFARGQVDCTAFTEDLLGSTTAAITTGLVRDAFAAITGETSSSAITVQVHASNIVCLRSGRTRNMYSGVSVVVNYTCNGASNPACNGNPTISQFDFGCVSGPPRWAASVDGSAENIVTTPPSGNFATTLRRDCGVCISPARSPFGTITNNEQHCGSCDPACNNSLRMCFNRVSSGCCSFYERDSCVASCTPPLVSNSNFDCVNDCPDLSITNGMVTYQPPGTTHFLDTTATYDCNTGYTLSDNNVRTCQDVGNGTWTGSDPSCDSIDCGTLTAPVNGMVDVSQGTTFGRVATYNCNGGYQLNGEQTRTCEAGGWSGNAPTCELPCPQCQNGGTCNVGTGTCTCPSGVTGNDCSEMMCPPCNGGTCDPTNGMCLCPPGFTGIDCSVRLCVPECVNGNCTNGACVCEPGYVGRDCSEPCSDKVANCKECREETNGMFTCLVCQPGYTLDEDTNECKLDVTAPPQIGGGCGGGCIAGIIIGIILAALLLAAIVAAIIFALYKHLSNPATQLKKGEAEGLNGVAKDNPLYVDPSTVEEEVGGTPTAATEEA